jgi:hypothetical protein
MLAGSHMIGEERTCQQFELLCSSGFRSTQMHHGSVVLLWRMYRSPVRTTARRFAPQDKKDLGLLLFGYVVTSDFNVSNSIEPNTCNGYAYRNLARTLSALLTRPHLLLRDWVVVLYGQCESRSNRKITRTSDSLRCSVSGGQLQ